MFLNSSESAAITSMPARASLIALAGWEIGKEVEVTAATMVLGRAVECEVCVNAPSVSRQHAQIELIEEDDERYFKITDLGSSNGTHVNNVRTVTARLHNGDKVKVGDVLFKFVLLDEIDSRFHRNVHRLIHYDQLTGLLTMDAFRSRLDAELRSARPGVHLVLAMTDLDGLKRVNDTYGHLAGRMVVGTMGRLILKSLKDGDHAGLYGGDEAIVLYPGSTLDVACERAEILRASVEAYPFEFDGKRFGVTISQGLAEFPAHGTTVEALIAEADRALYAAKAAGRNCVQTARRPEP